MPSGGKRIQLGDKCIDCNTELKIYNTIVKSGYIQSRCKDCWKINHSKVPSRSSEARHAQYINWKFDLPIEEYNKKLELQLGGCAICKKPCETRDNLSVDHDHITNQVRDLLCQKCNAALGLVNEDENILIEMIEYLKRHNNLKKYKVA
jgi:hypothetical protein